MKIKLLGISILLILLGCSSNTIPKGFDEEQLTNQAKLVIEFLHEAEYTKVIALMRNDVASSLPVEMLKDATEAKYAQVGTFEKYGQTVITDTTDPKNSEVYAVVIIVGEYSDGKATYTITFDKELACVGLYIK